METIYNLINEYTPLFWLGFAVILVVYEAMTVDLVAVWFACGATVAIIPAIIGTPYWVQISVFIIVAALLLIFTRPIVKKKILVKNTKTNADRNIGKIGLVIIDIDNISGTGRVKLDGQDWAAVSELGENISIGEQVIIKEIRGVKLVVDRIV